MAGLSLLALAGCANAQVSALTRAGTPAPAPQQVLVEVTPAPQATSKEAESASRAAAGLQAELLNRLAKAHVAAAPYSAAADKPGALVLHATIAAANPGNAAVRVIVGFGAGASRMLVGVDMHSGGQAPGPAEQFDVASHSAYRPGLILPGGVALATHSLWHLGIGGGIDVALNLRNGLAAPEANAAGAMVAQLKSYYTAEGWNWPVQNA
jgi:hypothetical protein